MDSIGSVIVSWDFSHGKDVGILLVGKQVNGRVDVINAFQGEAAMQLHSTLVPDHFCPICGRHTVVNGYCPDCSSKDKKGENHG